MDFYIGGGGGGGGVYIPSGVTDPGSVGLGGGGSGSGVTPNYTWNQMQQMAQQDAARRDSVAKIFTKYADMSDPAVKFASEMAGADTNPYGQWSTINANIAAGTPAAQGLLNSYIQQYRPPASIDTTYVAPKYSGNTLGGLFNPVYTPDSYTGRTYEQAKFDQNYGTGTYQKWLSEQQAAADGAKSDILNWRKEQDTKAKEFYPAAYETWLQKQYGQYQQDTGNGLLPQAKPLASDWKIKADPSLLGGFVEWLLADKDGVPHAQEVTSPDYKGAGLLNVGNSEAMSRKDTSTLGLPWHRLDNLAANKTQSKVDTPETDTFKPQNTATSPVVSMLPWDSKTGQDTGKNNYLKQYMDSNRRNLNWKDMA